MTTLVENPLHKLMCPVSYYFMAAYAYYVEDEPIGSDHMFDVVCRYLLQEFDNLPDHKHKYLLTKENLRAGTYLGVYPDSIRYATMHYKKHELQW
jgi:hypothetical protein